MTSILLSDSAPLRAYSDATLAALRDEAGLVSGGASPPDEPPRTFTRADVLAGSAADAEAAFSSWGMPSFTIDEIDSHLPRLHRLERDAEADGSGPLAATSIGRGRK